MRPHHLNALFRFVFTSVTLWLVLAVGLLLCGVYSVPVRNTEKECYVVTKKLEELSPRGELSPEVKAAVSAIQIADREAEFREPFITIGAMCAVVAFVLRIWELLQKKRANQSPQNNADKESLQDAEPGARRV